MRLAPLSGLKHISLDHLQTRTRNLLVAGRGNLKEIWVVSHLEQSLSGNLNQLATSGNSECQCELFWLAFLILRLCFLTIMARAKVYLRNVLCRKQESLLPQQSLFSK